MNMSKLVAISLATFSVVMNYASYAYAKDTLQTGEQLQSGQSLASNNGCFKFVMQGDGNLVLYAEGNVPIWNAGTTGKQGNVLIMQGDGNLVIYAPSSSPVWNSKTQGANARLSMQDDGNAVIYTGSSPLWATDTGGRSCGSSVLSPEQGGTVNGPNNKKSMGGGYAEAQATFYRSGLTVIETHSVSTSWSQGTRGSVFIVGSDRKGRALFVSPLFNIPTACSKPDTCSSNRRDTIQHKVNSEVAKYITKIDVYVQDRGTTSL
jgi:hypothetical protein